VATMTAMPNIALQRFRDYRDNPMVQALTRFITVNLERPLESVASWGVEISDKSHRTFYLHFVDGTKFSGQLREAWQVQVFQIEKEETPIVSEA
jgi:hypothetical protein